jgi:hypothetical protein
MESIIAIIFTVLMYTVSIMLFMLSVSCLLQKERQTRLREKLLKGFIIISFPFNFVLFLIIANIISNI